MEDTQRPLQLLARLDGPSVVPPDMVRQARTYREACRMAWQLRRAKNLTFRALSERCGLVYQHVGDYFNADDARHRRDLPGDALSAVEGELGNTFVSQWHAMRAQLTVVEEIQAQRRAA